jgi:hypothetical protein
MRFVVAGLLVTVLGPAVAAAPSDAPPPDMDGLVAKLGSNKYAEREAAMRALEQHGVAALNALEAATQHADPEVRHRAAVLLQRIESRLAVSRLLAGSSIRLVYKDVPVLDAVNDLAAKTGLTIDVEGDRLVLHQQTVTLDTAQTTLWEALGQFCKAAGLSERAITGKMPGIPSDNGYSNKPSTGIGIYPGYGPGTAGSPRIVLIDTKATVTMPTCCHGAVRFRAVKLPDTPPGSVKPAGTSQVVGFHLEVTPEPKLDWHGVVSLRVTKAVDDQGQQLEQPEPYIAEYFGDPLLGSGGAVVWDGVRGQSVSDVTGPQILPVRLQVGQKATAMLREVHGVVAVEVIAQQKLVTLANVMTAQGKTVIGSDGNALKVTAAKSSGASCTITVQISNAAPFADGVPRVPIKKTKNGVIIFGDPTKRPDMFALFDAKGQPLPLLSGEGMVVQSDSGGLAVQYELVFQVKDSQVPARLTYAGPKVMVVAIPFTLREVPLTPNPLVPPAPPILYGR